MLVLALQFSRGRADARSSTGVEAPGRTTISGARGAREMRDCSLETEEKTASDVSKAREASLDHDMDQN